MRRCTTLVLLPVGPGTNPEFLADTLESISAFADPDHYVLLADDSGEGLGDRFASERVHCLLLRSVGDKGSRTVSGRFFEKVASAIRHATETYDFKFLLRLDADALMTNPGIEARAEAIFREHQEYGLLGSFRTRCDGEPRDFSWPAEVIRKEIGFQVLPDRRQLARSLRELLAQATAHGYELGENVIAPGSIMSRTATEAVVGHPLFGHPSFKRTRLGDDHLTSLVLRATGFQPADFATGDLPLGVWLRHLQWSPEELVERGKCVVHSVRGYQDLDEAGVRARFRALRKSHSSSNR